MTNTVNRGENNFNLWLDVDSADNSGRSFHAYADQTGVDFTVFGLTYTDRDNYPVHPSEDFTLNLEETKALRDFLNDVIDQAGKVDNVD